MFLQLIHRSSRSFHNLKKFSVPAELKFTPCVQKDLQANILSGGRNHRMQLEGNLDDRQTVRLPVKSRYDAGYANQSRGQLSFF